MAVVYRDRPVTRASAPTIVSTTATGTIQRGFDAAHASWRVVVVVLVGFRSMVAQHGPPGGFLIWRAWRNCWWILKAAKQPCPNQVVRHSPSRGGRPHLARMADGTHLIDAGEATPVLVSRHPQKRERRLPLINGLRKPGAERKILAVPRYPLRPPRQRRRARVMPVDDIVASKTCRRCTASGVILDRSTALPPMHWRSPHLGVAASRRIRDLVTWPCRFNSGDTAE